MKKQSHLGRYYRRMRSRQEYRNYFGRDYLDEILPTDLLTVIDMQRKYFKHLDKDDLESKLQYQETKIKEATDKDASILFIEYGIQTTDQRLHRASKTAKNKHIMKKTYQNAFREPGMETLIKSYDAPAIHVMGCYAGACVKDFVFSAAKRGLPVVVHSEGLIAMDSGKKSIKDTLRFFELFKIPIV